MRHLRQCGRVWCGIVVMAAATQACGGRGSSGTEATEERKAALSTCDRTFSVSFPAGVSRDTVVLASTTSLTIRDGVRVVEPSWGFAAVSNQGSGASEIGADARTGSVTSVGSVTLRDRVAVTGDVRTAGTVTKGNGVTISGNSVAHAALTPPTDLTWSVCFPPTTSGDVNLAPDAARTLAPGSYGALVVNARARLSLSSGTYTFRSIDIEPTAVLQLDKSNGPIALYVSDSVIYRGSLLDQGGDADDFLIGYAGTQTVSLGGTFRGAFVAPSATVVLTTVSTGYTGTFFARALDVQARMTITHSAFPSWDTVANPPSANSPPGPRPSVLFANRILHHPPPLATAADVPAFVEWAGASTVEEHEDGRALMHAASGNDAIAAALFDLFRSAEYTDRSRARLALAILGEMQNAVGEQLLTSYIQEPLPTFDDFVGGEDEDARITAKASLQARAVNGLAYRGTSSAFEWVLWAAGQHPSRIVRGEAIASFLAWYPPPEGSGATARQILASVIRPEEQIFLDRVTRLPGETAATFNAKLAAFLQQHPEAVPPDPVRISESAPPPTAPVPLPVPPAF